MQINITYKNFNPCNVIECELEIIGR